jgi:predicted  nucleic acid-binding Zn-ribbon protein
MNELLQNLLNLQALQFGDLKEKNVEGRIAELRSKIPLPILGHYDRLLARGKRGVAIVRNQVCSGCHMRVPVAVVADLMRAEDIHICDNCGRYLHLASETENPFLDHLEEARVAEKEKPRKRKVAAHAL